MIAIPEAVIDALNGLLEAEVNSVFVFVMSSSPFLASAPPDLRKTLDEVHTICTRHQLDLVALIESVGGAPRVRNRVPHEEQYLSYLSLKFLLPKLVIEKDLLLTRFENAQAMIGTSNPHVFEALEVIEKEQRYCLNLLKDAAAKVTHGKFEPPVHQKLENAE